MNLSPYEKLCAALIGGLPENRTGHPGQTATKRRPTTTELAKKLGLWPATVIRWPLVQGTNIRIIPAARAELVEKLTNGAVTAEEIREFAKQHRSGSAA